MDSIDLGALTGGDRELVETSLKLYHAAKDDTSKIKALNGICENMMHEGWIKYQYLQHEMITAALKANPSKQEKRSLLKSLSTALNNIGYYYSNLSKSVKAMEYFQQSMKIYREVGDELGVSISLNNMGLVYDRQGDVTTALNHYHKSLKIREKMGDNKGIGTSLNNIALIYANQGDISKSLEFYHKSLKIRKEIGDKSGVANSLNNIGYIYKDQAERKNMPQSERDSLLRKSMHYFSQSLAIDEELGNKKGITRALINIGIIHDMQGDADQALNYMNKSLEIDQNMGDMHGATTTLILIGGIVLRNGNLTEAEQFAREGFEIAEKLGYPENIRNAAILLCRIHEKEGNHQGALEMYKLYIQMRDSINNEATQKAAIRQQTQYEFEKEQIRKENEAKEKARVEAEELKRRNNLEYSLIFLGILILFGLVMMLGFIKVSPNIAEGLIFFAFLIFFEFLLVFTEPYLEQYTQGEPIYALLANSGLALLIFPLHSLLESRLKKRIVK